MVFAPAFMLPWIALTAIPVWCISTNTSYTNPVLPGWNSDPSCIFVEDFDDTFFCITSTFLVFPGLPVYASKDLQNWKLVSHVLNRAEQLPELSSPGSPSNGTFANTLRYQNGTFYVITAYINTGDPLFRLFSTTNPYNDSAWNDPVHVENPGKNIDPDLFWDDDGKVYMAVAGGIWVSELNITTGAATETFQIWNGTGERNPEGPHFYKKDGYYYLLIAEGGTETNHSVAIARSTDIRGPYEGYPGNPLLTAKNTNDYFQTVGHADLFQDASGNWWGIALATRSGPEWEIYPMGRETVLFPVTWGKDEWPVADTIEGKMAGPLPPLNRHIPTDNPFIDVPEVVDFSPNSEFPSSFVFWRPPKQSLFTISAPGQPNTLQILPSRVNLTTDAAYEPIVDGLGFVARKQTSTLFSFDIDLSFHPTVSDEEAGISIFLTEYQHIDLGIVLLPTSNGSLIKTLRFRAETSGKPNASIPKEVILSVPESWRTQPIRLSVSTRNDSVYEFSASPSSATSETKILGSASALIVSGGSGPFTGTLVGVYATRNGGKGTTPALFSRWRYTPIAQEIDAGEFVSATGHSSEP